MTSILQSACEDPYYPKSARNLAQSRDQIYCSNAFVSTSVIPLFSFTGASSLLQTLSRGARHSSVLWSSGYHSRTPHEYLHVPGREGKPIPSQGRTLIFPMYRFTKSLLRHAPVSQKKIACTWVRVQRPIFSRRNDGRQLPVPFLLELDPWNEERPAQAMIRERELSHNV